MTLESMESAESALPLSVAQERIWFLNQMDSGNPSLVVSATIEIRGCLHVQKLQSAIDSLLERHQALRTVYRDDNGVPEQFITSTSSADWRRIDVGDLAPDLETEVDGIVRAEIGRSFLLVEESPFRASLLVVDPCVHYLVLTSHLIACDHSSLQILGKEISVHYNDSIASSLQTPPPCYSDAIGHERAQIESGVFLQEVAFWTSRLASVPTLLELPLDHPRGKLQSGRGGRETLDLEPARMRSVLKLLGEVPVESCDVFLAAYQLLLFRISGQRDVIVGSTNNCMRERTPERAVGCFENFLIFHTHVRETSSFADLLDRVHAMRKEAHAHSKVPFPILLDAFQLERDPGRSPLFQVTFQLILDAPDLITLRDCTVLPLEASDPPARHDLEMVVRIRNDEAAVELIYNADVFEPGRIREMLQQYQAILDQAAEDPGRNVDAFSLVTKGSGNVLPDPTTALDDTWYGPLPDRVREIAEQTPGRIAVRDSERCWTFEELHLRSNQLARWLSAQRIEAGEIVAIYGHRNASLLWAILGIMKTGGAFLMLDMGIPAARLVECFRTAGPSGLIEIEGAGDLPPALLEHVENQRLRVRTLLPRAPAGEHAARLSHKSQDCTDVTILPDHLSHLAFTSGSTGTPKGVMGCHRSLTHFETWSRAEFGFSQHDRFSLLAGLGFDLLQREMFTSLQCGGTLFIPETVDIAPRRLQQWMHRNRITVAYLTPQMVGILCEREKSSALPSLRIAFVIGDVLTPEHVTALKELSPGVTVVNLYGTTESQRAAGYYVVPNRAKPTSCKQIPIGKGIVDVQLLLLSAAHTQAGIGELAYIYMRTPHVAKGYWKDSDLTAERFLTNPFTGDSTDRLYKTGDLGRYLLDGNVEFLGRTDRQVKIRGFRVEIGDVESAISRHAKVKNVVVTARRDVQDASGESLRLVAYVVLAPGSECTVDGPTESARLISEIRAHLGGLLPHYMIPSNFVFLPAFPLSSSGKVDRNALPAPPSPASRKGDAYDPPIDDLEFQLVKLWEYLLRVRPIGRSDDFFALGGHSLLAVPMVVRLESLYGKRLPLATLFEAPTIGHLAEILRNDCWEPSWASLVTLQHGGTKPPLYLIHSHGGNVLEYRPLAASLGEDQPVIAIQSRDLNGQVPPSREVSEMASQYLHEIRTLQPQGPYNLAGFCFGGLVALEMAAQLLKAGEKIGLLAMLQTAAPPYSPREIGTS
jgi:amino acid adenylation domain-containing protein